MGDLIDIDDLGNWGVNGLSWFRLYAGNVITEEMYQKIYGCLCKLKDYESTGLSPDQVDSLIHKCE